VKFTLKSPFAEFPQLVGGSFRRSRAARSPISTRTHRYRSIQADRIRAGRSRDPVRNEAYWRDGEPYSTGPHRLFAGRAQQPLLSGDLDMTWWPSAEVLPIYQANKDITVSIAQSYGYQPIVMRGSAAVRRRKSAARSG
jgi:hypothetical protein